MKARSSFTDVNVNSLCHAGKSSLMLSDLVTLGTDDINQACVTHVIPGTKVIYVNLHRQNQALDLADSGFIGPSCRDPVKGRYDYGALRRLGLP